MIWLESQNKIFNLKLSIILSWVWLAWHRKTIQQQSAIVRDDYNIEIYLFVDFISGICLEFPHEFFYFYRSIRIVQSHGVRANGCIRANRCPLLIYKAIWILRPQDYKIQDGYLWKSVVALKLTYCWCTLASCDLWKQSVDWRICPGTIFITSMHSSRKTAWYAFCRWV